MITYEEAIKVLKALKENAEYVKEGERKIYSDLQKHMVEEEKKTIIDTLVKLELE